MSQAIAAGNLDRELSAVDETGLGTQDLSELFGIELNSATSAAAVSVKKKPVAKEKSGATKTSSQKKVVEPAGRIEKSVKQKKAASKRAPKAGSVEPATSFKARKSVPNKLSRKKADSEKSPSRKTRVAKTTSAITTKKEQMAKKMAANAAAIIKTVVKQKSAAREVRRSSKVD